MHTSPNGEARGALVPAVDRAVTLLRLLQDGGGGHGVSELSRAAGLHKSTVHDILHTLCHHRLVEQDPATKRFRLAAGLLEFSAHVRERLDLRRAARAHLADLARATGETVFLGAFDGDHVMIVDKEESGHDLKITSPVGRRIPYCAGAFGKVFLAALPAAERDRLLRRRPLRAFTARSITDAGAYARELVRVRRDGFALDDEEYLDGVRAAAAPVVDGAGRVVGALSAVGLKARLKAPAFRALGPQAAAAARAVSERLGATRYPAWDGVATTVTFEGAPA
jgi:IclR family transcriptional regulator, KDG regulon repressor